jgi:hypothetical protein
LKEVNGQRSKDKGRPSYPCLFRVHVTSHFRAAYAKDL